MESEHYNKVQLFKKAQLSTGKPVLVSPLARALQSPSCEKALASIKTGTKTRKSNQNLKSQADPENSDYIGLNALYTHPLKKSTGNGQTMTKGKANARLVSLENKPYKKRASSIHLFGFFTRSISTSSDALSNRKDRSLCY